MNKLVEWLFRHYLMDKYIRKTEIQTILQKAHEDEAEIQLQIYNQEMDRIRIALENEKFLSEQSLQGEIRRLSTFVDLSYKKVKRADESYYQSCKALRHNRQMAQDVTEKLKELMTLLGTLFGSIEDIERDLSLEIKLIEVNK